MASPLPSHLPLSTEGLGRKCGPKSKAVRKWAESVGLYLGLYWKKHHCTSEEGSPGAEAQKVESHWAEGFHDGVET